MKNYALAKKVRCGLVASFHFMLALITVPVREAVADTTLGVQVLFDRAPDDFSEPMATKLPVDIAHTFANGVMIGGSIEPQIKSGSDDATYDLEGTVGYGWKLNDVISIGGSAGVGERFTGEFAFPYYVLRVRADIEFSERWTWNTITYRFRDSFESSNDYNTPEVATGFSFKVDDSHSISVKYYYSWKEGTPEDQGIGIGYKFHF